MLMESMFITNLIILSIVLLGILGNVKILF